MELIATRTGRRRLSGLLCALMFAISGSVGAAAAQPVRDPTRGELLYTTHCIACHTAQVHWREKKIATDWTRLHSQVRRWQVNSGLEWSDEDITAVARYLNALHYHYPMPD